MAEAIQQAKRKRKMSQIITYPRIFVWQYFKIVQLLIDNGASIYGPFIDEYLVNKFATLQDPFDTKIHDQETMELYNLFEKKPIYAHVPLIEQAPPFYNLFSKAQYKKEKNSGVEFHKYVIDENFGNDTTVTITVYIPEHLELIRTYMTNNNVKLPLLQIFNTDGFKYNQFGLTHISKYDPSNIKNIVNKKCKLSNYVLPSGIQPNDIITRKYILKKVCEKLDDGWDVESAEFKLINEAPSAENAICVICQEEITGKHYQVKCSGNHIYHTLCLANQINKDFEEHSFSKCAQCRHEIKL
jgi:hypothetical protein